jgi:hypothetical protein
MPDEMQDTMFIFGCSCPGTLFLPFRILLSLIRGIRVFFRFMPAQQKQKPRRELAEHLSKQIKSHNLFSGGRNPVPQYASSADLISCKA